MIASKGVARFIGESDADTASSSANGMLLLDGALDGGDKEPARDVKDPEVAFTKRSLEYPNSFVKKHKQAKGSRNITYSVFLPSSAII